MINAPITTLKTYAYTVFGSGANGQTWQVSGTVQCEFIDAFNAAMKATFEDLTKGKALYGQPGIGCNGPYDVTKVLLEQLRQ